MPPSLPSKLVQQDVASFSLSPDARNLLTTSGLYRDCHVRLFNTDSLEERLTFRPKRLIPYSIAFVRDDMAVLIGLQKKPSQIKKRSNYKYVLQRLRVAEDQILEEDFGVHRGESGTPFIFGANEAVVGLHYWQTREDLVSTMDLSTVIQSRETRSLRSELDERYRALAGSRLFKLLCCRQMEGGWGPHFDLYCFGQQQSPAALTQSRPLSRTPW